MFYTLNYPKSLAQTRIIHQLRRNFDCIILHADVCNFLENVWLRVEAIYYTPMLHFFFVCPKLFLFVLPLLSATNKELLKIYPSKKTSRMSNTKQTFFHLLNLTFLAKNISAIVTAMSKNDRAYFDDNILKIHIN